MFSEQDMENAIAENPTRFLKRRDLKLLFRQYSIGKFRFDLLFADQSGRKKIIVEIQKGTLDRNHSFKIVDYSLKYRAMHPDEEVEVIIVANAISQERKRFFSELNYSFIEIPDEEIIIWKTEQISISGNAGDTKNTHVKPFVRKSIQSPNPLRQQLLDEVKQKIPAFSGRPVDITKNNISAPAGKSGCEWIIVTRNNDCRAELAFRDKNTANVYYKKMEIYKANIENEFGEKLYWDFKPGRKDQYIKTVDKRFSEISGNLEEVINYLVERMRKFMSVVGNYWDKIK